MKIVIETFSQTCQWYWPCLKKSWMVLLPLTLTITGLHEYFVILEKFAVANNDLLLAKGGQAMSGLLESGILIILLPLRFHEVAQGKPSRALIGFAQKHFWPLFIESLRALTSVIVWTLMLIFPGVYRYVRLSLVPYVVYFDQDYHNNNVDALKRSSELTRGASLYILFLLILTTFIYLYSHSLLDGLHGIIHLQGLFLVKLMNMSISVFTYGVFYSIYRRADSLSRTEAPTGDLI